MEQVLFLLIFCHEVPKVCLFHCAWGLLYAVRGILSNSIYISDKCRDGALVKTKRFGQSDHANKTAEAAIM